MDFQLILSELKSEGYTKTITEVPLGDGISLMFSDDLAITKKISQNLVVKYFQNTTSLVGSNFCLKQLQLMDDKQLDLIIKNWALSETEQLEPNYLEVNLSSYTSNKSVLNYFSNNKFVK